MSELARQEARYTWLRLAVVAREAGDVSTWTVRQWIAAGQLKALNVGTKLRPEYRVKREWLETFLMNRTVG